ncbi:MAG: hypothetical protein IKN55_08675 [Oscillospiraceae bacterium]|nr:hypothetical protein [Oscillospiraceae bacterium]
MRHVITERPESVRAQLVDKPFSGADASCVTRPKPLPPAGEGLFPQHLPLTSEPERQ